MKAMRPRDIADCVGTFLKQGDIEGIVDLFHPECRIVFPKGADPQIGRDAVRRIFTPFVAAQPSLISNVTGELIAGDTALLTAEWRIEDDHGAVLDHGESTEVAKQNADGSWVYFLDCPYGPPETRGS